MEKKSLYYGNEQQIRGVETYSLLEGKARGMQFMRVRNGLGLEVEVSLDRCLDLSRVTYKGVNIGYLSPTGHVAPTYYNSTKDEMIHSFTGGFLTTCGLDNVGGYECVNGVDYPLHGRISNQPGEHCYWEEKDSYYVIHGTIWQAGLFLNKLRLQRSIFVGKEENTIAIQDEIKNTGDQQTPCMILYHMNMGYPLLTEHAKLEILSEQVTARNEFAKEHIQNWNEIEKPGSLSEEACYFHTFKERGFARLYNPDVKTGVEISFDPKLLPCFTQWKMMGKYDYVLGLEPGNCYPKGRENILKENEGVLLLEQQSVNYKIEIKIVEE